MLRYITRAEACAARHLKTATPIPAACAVVVPGYMPFQEIPLAAPAALEVSQETQTSAPVFTAKLTLTLSCPHWTPPPGPLALRLTCADGTRLLLGTAQRPFPLMARAATHPARTAEQCAQTLTFTLTAPTPPLEIRE